MGIKSFLSAREKEELLEFLAATGENYQRYCEYADQRGWKKFTPKYLHTWVQRRRPKIRVARERHNDHVRQMSMYIREKRIKQLEEDLDILNGKLEHMTVTDYLKALVVKAKLLEQIAKERGEWGVPEEKTSIEPSARDRLRLISKEMLNQTTQTKASDG